MTMTYNEVKELLNTIAAPCDTAFFEKMADVSKPCEVEIDSTVRVVFATKKGNECDYTTSAPDNEQRVIGLAKAATVVRLDWRKAKYRPKKYYVATKKGKKNMNKQAKR